MNISHENNNILVNDLDPNKGNNNNLTMYGKKLENVKSLNILGLY